MDVKKKLVELLKESKLCSKRFDDQYSDGTIAIIADHLIANGVTVQEWISVEEGLPDEHETVLVWLGNNRYSDHRKSTDSIHEGRWWRWGKLVTHWSPWNMPDPPKGE